MNLVDKIKDQAEKLLEQSEIKTSDLIAFLNTIEVTASDLQEYRQSDPEHPYGRKVLLNHTRLEVMLATWTRDYPCAPHDHGGSNSAIKILQGRSHHCLYSINEDRLNEVYAEKRNQGEILICAPKQIHSMGDDGLENVLVTLHAYSGSIPDMIIYDENNSFRIKGCCGAWIPENEDDILFQKKGHFYRADLEAAEI